MDKALRLPVSTHTLDDTVEALREGHMQAFWNDEAIVITEICVTPRRRFLNIFLAAGLSMEALLLLKPQVVEFARHHGLDEIRSICRPGMAAVAKKKLGWESMATVMHLPLDRWDD